MKLSGIDKIFAVVVLVVAIIGFTMEYAHAATTVSVPSHFDETDESAWQRLERRMQQLPKGSTLILNWRGLGGDGWMGSNFIEELKWEASRGVTVVVSVIGASVSMHALVVCHAPEFRWAGGYLVFHQGYTGRMNGKKIYSRDTSIFDACVDRGLLTREDVYKISVQHKRIEVYSNGRKVVKEDWK